jgi:hypothetical protein
MALANTLLSVFMTNTNNVGDTGSPCLGPLLCQHWRTLGRIPGGEQMGWGGQKVELHTILVDKQANTCKNWVVSSWAGGDGPFRPQEGPLVYAR